MIQALTLFQKKSFPDFRHYPISQIPLVVIPNQPFQSSNLGFPICIRSLHTA